MATTELPIRTAPETPSAGYEAHDDLRHRPAPGGRMRDSLFWQMTMPDEELGFQAYMYLSDRGRTGYNVAVWGPDGTPVVLDREDGRVGDDADFDDFRFGGLHVRQPELRRTAEIAYESDAIRFRFDYTALHDPFSYRQNPDGLPGWFAINRFEQTGWVRGFLEVGDRRVEWDRVGHRDHSWGTRNWGVPHHWKWFIAYTPDGTRAVNGWIWIAYGEWGFGGYVVRDGELLPVTHIEHHAEYDDDMTQRRLEAELVDVRGGSTRLVLDRFGLVELPTHDKMDTVIMEAACRASIDGVAGGGQFETHWPRSYLGHLADARKA
jgi:hypothetical protein